MKILIASGVILLAAVAVTLATPNGNWWPFALLAIPATLALRRRGTTRR